MASSSQKQGIRPLGIVVRFVVGLAAIGAAAAFFGALVATRPETPRQPQQQRTLAVRTITAERAETPHIWRGYGTALARREADLTAQVSAVVTDRPDGVEAGVFIEQGDLIVQLDSEEYEARLARAREAIRSMEARLANLAVEERSTRRSLELAEEATRLMQWELERLQEAEQAGAAGPAEINRLMRQLTTTQREEERLRQQLDSIEPRRSELKAQIEVERSNARLAQIDVRRCRITAPFSGRIQSVDVKEGERLQIGAPVARLVDLSLMETPVRVPVSAAASLEIGGRATLVAEGPRRQTWAGEIVRIAPEADAQTRTIAIYTEIRQDPESPASSLLVPGQFVTAKLEDSAPPELLPVPRGAVDEDVVMVVDEEGRARPRRVTISHYLEGSYPSIDEDESQWAAVSSGLAVGDRVIVSNLDELEPGQLVETGRRATAAADGEAPLASTGKDPEASTQ